MKRGAHSDIRMALQEAPGDDADMSDRGFTGEWGGGRKEGVGRLPELATWSSENRCHQVHQEQLMHHHASRSAVEGEI